ncbi:VanZ family protein [Lachnospiraceae bacterium MD1]|uniref:VanZ family protein n=1 Tax=Variimorphobacter saccharofermentans TaxID=2755051 RepID=A0A839JW70_9FIRM|nr:VanZ family protein [Variimorphobacter saccharofermentans]MBB2181507.1 VanZ family protein [Variimorphobacter saccharofermentans]
MQRRTNIQVSSMIILLSILTILIQFVTYYFFASYIIIWGISLIISLICCHLLLEQSVNYDTCFQYSILTLFISLIIIVLTYFEKDYRLLPFTGAMAGIAFINWFAPLLHCYIRSMIGYGTKIDDFGIFYRNSNIIFYLFYIGVLIYGNFSPNAFPWAYRAIGHEVNVMPFDVISVQIEDYLFGAIPLSNIIIYLLSRIAIFIPYGFGLALLLRHQSRLVKFFSLLVIPFIIEAIQYFTIPARCDIDDLIYALLGGLIGSALFLLSNFLYRIVNGRDFLSHDTEFHFSKNTYHY